MLAGPEPRIGMRGGAGLVYGPFQKTRASRRSEVATWIQMEAFGRRPDRYERR